MNAELQHQLYTKYPEIFCDVGKSPQETPMAWGIECGSGWFELLDTMLQQIQHHQKYNSKTGHPVVAEQVKEKFGTLRFYYRGGDDIVHGIVQMAEAQSAKTCERCGQPGKIRRGGWLKALCEACNQ